MVYLKIVRSHPKISSAWLWRREGTSERSFVAVTCILVNDTGFSRDYLPAYKLSCRDDEHKNVGDFSFARDAYANLVTTSVQFLREERSWERSKAEFKMAIWLLNLKWTVSHDSLSK